ncbi:hypothetical protein Tco_1179882 [Tanacetum coccineum]
MIGFSARIMEMELDIENMTLNEYLEYKAEIIGAKNLRGIGQKKVQNGCVMVTHPRIRTMKTDITIEDVKLLRQFLMPNVPDEIDEVIQPLIPQPIHTTPPNDDYVAPATKSILDKLLEESRDEILNVTMVEEEADFNPTRDIEELERLLTKDPQSYFIEIQVHSVITKLKPCIHTQPMSPLYGIFESYESSTKPYKVYREMKSLSRSMYILNELCGHVLWKPSRDFTHPLGPPSGLKGLLHMLNATFYESDDELLKSWMLLEEADLEHGFEHVVSTSYRANPGE